MVAPVTGPFTEIISMKGPPNSNGFKPDYLRIQRTSYRQRRPYNLPLEFEYDLRRILTQQSSSPVEYATVSNLALGVHGGAEETAMVKAYSRFADQVRGASAQLSVSLAERKQALEMISARSEQLLRFVSNLRRYRFREAARVLGVNHAFKRTPNLRKDSRAFSKNYLEFHFGWSPLVSDIGNAVEILQKGLPPFRVRATATSTERGVNLTLSPGIQWSFNSKVSVVAGAEIEITNPNLWRANELGFVNPALVAWELVPFSFVLDWFVNVSDFLGSFSEFWGLTLHRPFYTRYSISEQRYKHYSPSVVDPERVLTNYYQGVRVNVKRNLGVIPGPSLRVRDPWVLQPRRALAAVSLLIQKLL